MLHLISSVIYIVTGAVFILGGVLKWIALPPFEFQLVKDGLADWSWVVYFSRFITGAEIILGLILILFRPFRRLASYPVIMMLLSFTAYLIYTLIKYGSSGNCGCFGEAIPISTESSIQKNVIMIAFLIFAVIRDKEPVVMNWRLPLLVSIVVYSMLFILTPLRSYIKPAEVPVEKTETTEKVIPQTSKEERDSLPPAGKAATLKKSVKKDKTSTVVENLYPQKTSVFGRYTSYSAGTFNPDEGEKIIALFSLDCEHCLEAAAKLAQQKTSLPQILILFLGEAEQVEPFVNQSGLNAPYIILPPEEFFPLLKQSPPRLIYLINGNVVKEWEGVGNLDLRIKSY